MFYSFISRRKLVFLVSFSFNSSYFIRLIVMNIVTFSCFPRLSYHFLRTWLWNPFSMRDSHYFRYHIFFHSGQLIMLQQVELVFFSFSWPLYCIRLAVRQCLLFIKFSRFIFFFKNKGKKHPFELRPPSSPDVRSTRNFIRINNLLKLYSIFMFWFFKILNWNFVKFSIFYHLQKQWCF